MRRALTLTIALAVCGTTMTGCSWFGGKKQSSAVQLELQAKADRQKRLNGYRKNLSPQIRTMKDRRTDIANLSAYNKNANRRLFWSDFRSVMYMDRPSRLTPYPTTY